MSLSVVPVTGKGGTPIFRQALFLYPGGPSVSSNKRGLAMPMELIVGAAVGAAVASPKLRKTIRKGFVYGLAGALIAYDNVSSLASKARNLRRSTPKESAPTTETSAADRQATAPETPIQASPPESSVGTAPVQ
jgi:hypothetical protein